MIIIIIIIVITIFGLEYDWLGILFGIAPLSVWVNYL